MAAPDTLTSNNVNEPCPEALQCERPEVLRFERRKAERALRIKRMKDRIEKEKEEAKLTKPEEGVSAKINYSERVRMMRVYEWYNRCGMPPRDNFKERVIRMGYSSGVTEEDVDLLPWNNSGKRVDLKMMLKL